jgi:hypothetical protein
MGTYQRETLKVVARFLHHQVSYADCVAALDAQLAKLISRLTGGQIADLRALMLSNNETVMAEMARRASDGSKFKK